MFPCKPQRPPPSPQMPLKAPLSLFTYTSAVLHLVPQFDLYCVYCVSTVCWYVLRFNQVWLGEQRCAHVRPWSALPHFAFFCTVWLLSNPISTWFGVTPPPQMQWLCLTRLVHQKFPLHFCSPYLGLTPPPQMHQVWHRE